MKQNNFVCIEITPKTWQIYNPVFRLKPYMYVSKTKKHSFKLISPQDRRVHLRALKVDQCWSQVFEFYSFFSQPCICTHDYRGLYFTTWVDLLFIENEFFFVFRVADQWTSLSRLPLLVILSFIKQRRQDIAFITLFWKERKCIKIGNLKPLFLQKFIAHLMTFFINVW